MDWIHLALGLSTLLCSLVAGFVFAFAVVVMPGIQTLSDRDYLRAFKVMDRDNLLSMLAPLAPNLNRPRQC
jgi:hypothetical protein